MAGPCQAGARKEASSGKTPAPPLRPAPHGPYNLKVKKSSNSITARKSSLLGGIGVLASIFLLLLCCLGPVRCLDGWLPGWGGCGVAAGLVGEGGSQLKTTSPGCGWRAPWTWRRAADLLVSVVSSVHFVDGAVVLVERRGRARVLLERGIFFQVGVVDEGDVGLRILIRNWD